MVEDLCCKPNEDRLPLTQTDLGDTLGHPSSRHRPVDSQGEQVDVLGCWSDLNSASLRMRRKDEMGLQCFSSALRSTEQLSVNTLSSGSIV